MPACQSSALLPHEGELPEDACHPRGWCQGLGIRGQSEVPSKEQVLGVGGCEYGVKPPILCPGRQYGLLQCWCLPMAFPTPMSTEGDKVVGQGHSPPTNAPQHCPGHRVVGRVRVSPRASVPWHLLQACHFWDSLNLFLINHRKFKTQRMIKGKRRQTKAVESARHQRSTG
jgi:hypothetical protein